jgi:hypothetical protein
VHFHLQPLAQAFPGSSPGTPSPVGRSSSRGRRSLGLPVVPGRPSDGDDRDHGTCQFVGLVNGDDTLGDKEPASEREAVADDGFDGVVHLFRFFQMSMTFLMMTVSAASDPRVTLRLAMIGSGTMLAMKSPPAGPPTPMPRSRRESWRWGMG